MPEGSMTARLVTRRNFLYLSGLAATGLVVTACGGNDALPGQTPTSPSPTAGAQATVAGQAPLTVQQTQVAAPLPSPAATNLTPTVPKQFKEAPQLADQVKQGKLPPVDQRLPKNPVVVQPIEKVGKYGGTWRAGILGPADSVWLQRTIGYEGLVRWDPEWKQIIPNVAESYTASPDAKEFTFKLCEGLRWSDGQPLTADDITFWWEDVATNKDVSPGGTPLYMRPGGKAAGTVEKVDQHTVKFKFEQPNGLFLVNMAAGGGVDPTRFPKHYLQQFHLKYNPNAEQQAGADGWVKTFQSKGSGVPGTPVDARWYNKDLPVLHGWLLTTNFSSGGTRLVAERNPYYFKVDPEGNQLPYLDRVNYEIIPDLQAMVLKAVAGEIDMQDRHIATNTNKAVFTDNMQKGNYHFFETVGSGMNEVAITLNLTHKDPVKRQIFQNKDFRIGLSHAINRQEIIDVVFVGQGEPWQLAPRKETPFFNERLAKQYTEFDEKKANEHLDRAFPKKNAQGQRLGPNDQPISFVIEVVTDQTTRVDSLNLIRRMWQKVGVDMQVKTEDRALLYNRKDANEHDAVVWGGDGGLKDALIEMRYYFPFSFESNFAQAWTAWYNPGGNPRTAAEEPPEATKRQMELYNQIQATGDEAKQVELVKQILDIAADQFYCMGIVLPPNGYGIVKNNFLNVPKSMYSTGGPYLNPGPTNPSQYFIQ